jgi:N-acetylmuramoyl-L-alanine amidase
MATILTVLKKLLYFCDEPPLRTETGKVIGVCVGHSRGNDKGAVNTDGVNEHKFNRMVGLVAAAKLKKYGHVVHFYDHYEGNSYGAAMSWLAADLKQKAVDVAIELHFNSSSSQKAEGHEWLYWKTSKKSQKLAEVFRKDFAFVYAGRKDRGIKPKDESSRGAAFLSKTHCPSIICEPFFGSNPEETAFFSIKVNELGLLYAAAIHKFLQ